MTHDEIKKAAAEAALEFVDGGVVGVGTGTTSNYFIDALAGIKHRIDGAVASSEETGSRLRSQGIALFDLNDVGQLPLYVDGADEATAHRQLVKGGGGALTREKVIASASDRFVCIADHSKLVEVLGRFPLPVEVIPMARSVVARRIAALGGAPEWRQGFVTDNGNAILDVRNLKIVDPPKLEAELNQIPGVVTNGLFAIRRADILLLGAPGGIRRLE